MTKKTILTITRSNKDMKQLEFVHHWWEWKWCSHLVKTLCGIEAYIHNILPLNITIQKQTKTSFHAKIYIWKFIAILFIIAPNGKLQLPFMNVWLNILRSVLTENCYSEIKRTETAGIWQHNEYSKSFLEGSMPYFTYITLFLLKKQQG